MTTQYKMQCNAEVVVGALHPLQFVKRGTAAQDLGKPAELFFLEAAGVQTAVTEVEVRWFMWGDESYRKWIYAYAFMQAVTTAAKT